MARSLICLCLTGQTLEDDLEITNHCRQYIDLVELRVDFLKEDEQLRAREFPRMVKMPCILTIRRTCDGGRFSQGEGARAALFARALAFADEDSRKNFAYVDFEEDFHVPSLEDAVLAFGTKIIRSFHDMKNPVRNIADKLASLRKNSFEIPKIAFMPHRLSDVTSLFEQAARIRGTQQILCAMGTFGFPTRVLASRLKSYLTYTSPAELLENMPDLGHSDPKTLETLYRFRSISENTRIFGITGWPLKITSSPKLHNEKMKQLFLDSVYIPFRAETSDEAFEFAQSVGVIGFSVTIPHKESIIDFLDFKDENVVKIGACNTVVKESDGWHGYNTDCDGFSRSLLDFVEKSTGVRNILGKKVSVIGAGGASRAVVYVLKQLGAKACIFNRTGMKARRLAEKFGFEWACLTVNAAAKISEYSDIIIQTTSKGMGDSGSSSEENDPIWFYDFSGKELVYDVIYEPRETPILKKAAESGCKTCCGYSMLIYQALAQIEHFMKAYSDNTPVRDRESIIRMMNILFNSLEL